MKRPGADPEGGAGGARPPFFVPNSLKKSPKLTKKSWGQAPENPLRPLLFQILDPTAGWQTVTYQTTETRGIDHLQCVTDTR